jgi:hypothetical protein
MGQSLIVFRFLRSYAYFSQWTVDHKHNTSHPLEIERCEYVIAAKRPSCVGDCVNITFLLLIRIETKAINK